MPWREETAKAQDDFQAIYIHAPAIYLFALNIYRPDFSMEQLSWQDEKIICAFDP